MLISEIQQNSNITYRVDDYGRLGADGKPRPLHVEQAADVVDVTLDAVNVGRAREGTSDRVDDTGSAILRRTDAAGAANGTDAAGAADGTDGADAADGTDAAGAADSANWTAGADATNAAGAADATDGGNTVRTDNAEAVTLTDWPYFRARMVTVGADENGIARFHAGSESFHAILALDDGLELHYNDGMESVGVARGQTVFVPAGMGLYELRPAADLLSYSDLDEVPVCALPPRESPSGANHSAADAAHSDSRPYSQSVAQRGAPLSGASAPFRAVRALLTDIIRDAL